MPVYTLKEGEINLLGNRLAPWHYLFCALCCNYYKFKLSVDYILYMSIKSNQPNHCHNVTERRVLLKLETNRIHISCYNLLSVNGHKKVLPMYTMLHLYFITLITFK